MKSTALITGSSRGIGAEFARLFASKGANLILVARDGKDLKLLKEEIENRFEVSVRVIEKDLSVPENVKSVYDEIKEAGIEVNYLINNAGFGDLNYFLNTEWKRQEEMINLNIAALSQLCHLFGNDWKKRKSGKILNVSSTASFQPGPGMSVYYASKAYVTSFSQALDYELRKSGITVTTLCPGPTDSNFAKAARVVEPNKLLKDRKLPSSKELAEFGYKAMMKDKSLVIHGVLNSLIANLVGILPRKLVLKISAKVLAWK